jgi:hypothetical protein
MRGFDRWGLMSIRQTFSLERRYGIAHQAERLKIEKLILRAFVFHAAKRVKAQRERNQIESPPRRRCPIG